MLDPRSCPRKGRNGGRLCANISSMQPYRRLIESIEAEGAAALVSLVETKGSSPREAGAVMVVRPSGGFYGTIGGGAMEWRALAEARETLGQGRGASRRSVVALGPELAQCCGGRVEWRIETFDDHDLERLRPLAEAERGAAPGRAVYLFGAGHVGRALALALAPLPFQLRWIEFARGRVPRSCAGERDARPIGRSARRTGWRARRRLRDRHDAFASARSRDRRGGAAAGSLRLCRPDRLGDQARALSQPDARGGASRGGARQARLPDRNMPASRARSRRLSRPRSPRSFYRSSTGAEPR